MTALELAERGEQVKHHECEDCWYSCPESVEGCCDDDREGCTCHAPLIHEMAAMLREQDATITQVLDLHRPDGFHDMEGVPHVCVACDKNWPCPTVRLLAPSADVL